MSKSKLSDQTETKLRRIAKLSSEDPCLKFKWLMPHFNVENLTGCFHGLDGRKAVGIDGKTKGEYGRELEENVESLIEKMKRMSYRPQPVREVLIPKANGSYRPLGISGIEDKIVQSMTAKVLSGIYEPIFSNNSFGFRSGRSCHKAIKSVRNYLMLNKCEVVLDVDLENFFGQIDHQKLLEILAIKIEDKTFLRYISRMLKAGIMTVNGPRPSPQGTPQGSIVSPILANIFAHFVIDGWFETVVKKHLKGKAEIFRYADDFVICCERESDAHRILKALKGRLGKYGLKLNTEKTKLIRFDRRKYSGALKQETFDFLGFTFYVCKRHGVIKVKTSSKSLRSGLTDLKNWLIKNRCKMRFKDLWVCTSMKIKGHVAYFGVTFNHRMMSNFIFQATKIFFKWVNRRSQRRSITWKNFNKFTRLYPIPRPKTHFDLYQWQCK